MRRALAVLIAMGAVAMGIGSTPALADPASVAAKKREVNALKARLNAVEQRVSAAAERYNGARWRLSVIKDRLVKNQKALERAIAGPAAGAELAPRVWVGDAVSIRDPSNAVLARRPGANVAVIAQAAESGTATLAMGMVSLAAQLPAARARFVVLDGMSAGEQPTASLAAVRDAIPHPSESHGIREADAAVI